MSEHKIGNPKGMDKQINNILQTISTSLSFFRESPGNCGREGNSRYLTSLPI
jgi:hypothetical protein